LAAPLRPGRPFPSWRHRADGRSRGIPGGGAPRRRRRAGALRRSPGRPRRGRLAVHRSPKVFSPVGFSAIMAR